MFVTGLLFLQHCSLSGAWSYKAHDRIARIGQGLLHGKHRDQIRTMMHSDVIDAATWETSMTEKYPVTAALHYHRQMPEWSCGSRGGLGDKGGHMRCDDHGARFGSLFCALAYFFEHFAHDALLKEFPPPKEPIGTPKELPILKGIPSNSLQPSDFLRWLAILIGDLHQPLHWLSEHAFGREIEIHFRNQSFALHDFWEEQLPLHLSKRDEGLHPDKADKEYAERMPGWEQKLPTELFREWGKETAEKVCSQVYAPMTVNHADGTRVDNPFTLTEELFQNWLVLTEELIQLAGERLAFVLNEIIEHKRHKEANKHGRGLPSRKVAVGMEKVAPPKWIHTNKHKGKDLHGIYRRIRLAERRRSMSNLAWNASIAAVVVPLLLISLRWHEGVGGGNFFRIKEHLKM